MNRRELLLGASAFALAPRMRRERALRPVALVTADLESRLVVVDLPRRARPPAPRHAPVPAQHRARSAGPRSSPTRRSAPSRSWTTPSLLLRHVLHDFSEPRYTAAHPDGRHAYVTDARRGEVVALDVHTARVLGRARVGSRARHVSIDSAGRTLWVALGTKADEIAVVDVADRGRPRLVRRFRPPFLAHDVGFAPDGRHAWVSSGDRNRLAVYDTRTGRLLARPYGDAPPQHVTFAGGRVYVTSGWSGTLRVHRADGRSLAPHRRPGRLLQRPGRRSAGSSRPRSAAAI